MPLRETIDELDLLVVELTELRQQLRYAELRRGTSVAGDQALWDAEAVLRRVATRSEHRAALLRRAIELRLDDQRPRTA